MKKTKSILKAFVVIALIPILLIGGIVAVSFVAPLCFDGLSNPFFAFPAVILMLPWGFLFALLIFMGIGLTPSFVIIPTGNGGFATSSGSSRNGNGCSFIFNILKLVILVPTALLIWLTVSIIILFSPKLQNKIDELYIEFISYLKKWYKFGVIFFIISPLIVLGFNGLENSMYSPNKIDFEFVNLNFENTYKAFSNITCEYHMVNSYNFEYSINANEKDIKELKGQWEFIDKTTGKSLKLDEGSLVPYNWNWDIEDKSIAHQFNFTITIPQDNKEDLKIISKDLKYMKIVCHITYIAFDSNIPIFGDWMFPTVDNEYKNGFEIVVKP